MEKLARITLSALLIIMVFSCENGGSGNEPDDLSVSFLIKHVSVFGGNDGEIHASVKGGVPPYVLNWSQGNEGEDLLDITAGWYYLLATDNVGKTISDSAEVTQPDPLILQFRIEPASSVFADDGSVDLTISGGVPPYHVCWSTGDTIEDISGLPPGEYIVTVVDDHFAQSTDTVIIEGGAVPCLDADGNEYDIVQIGSRIWMRENLKVTHSPDGGEIVSYCYGDDPSAADLYGRLYTWHAAMNGSAAEQAQGICPDGWHIPSDEEWKELEIYLGMSREEADMSNIWRGTDQGTRLIAGGSSGYDALLCGRRSAEGNYSLLGSYEYVWTSTEYGSYSWRRCLRASSTDVGRWNTFPKTYAFSVRCIKNAD